MPQLQQARVDLERTQIRSPVDGIVIKRSVEVGQTVAASLQAPELFVIARNLSDMQVEAAIDEADISRVRDGQKVSFSIDAFPGRMFDGSVRQVRKAAVSAQNVVSYTVVVGFANPGSLMLPGMTANVRIITDTRDNVLKVPNAALRVRIAGVEPEAAAVGPAPGNGASAVRTGSFGLWPQALAQGAPGRPGALRERLVEGLQLDARAAGPARCGAGRDAAGLHGAARISRRAARCCARAVDGQAARPRQCLPDAGAARGLCPAAGPGRGGAASEPARRRSQPRRPPPRARRGTGVGRRAAAGRGARAGQGRRAGHRGARRPRCRPAGR